MNATHDDRKPHKEDGLYDLFSSLDQVTASDELKSSTLAFLLSQADAAGDQGLSDEVQGHVAQPQPEPSAAALAAGVPAYKAVATSAGTAKKPGRSRWRVMRVAAVAACLALALTGGAAYATPTSYVTISQDETTIELGVNRFGMTVAATSEDEMGKELVDTTELRNMPYEESLARAAETLREHDAETPLHVSIASGDDVQKNDLEQRSESVLATQALAPEAQPGTFPEDTAGDDGPRLVGGQSGPAAEPNAIELAGTVATDALSDNANFSSQPPDASPPDPAGYVQDAQPKTSSIQNPDAAGTPAGGETAVPSDDLQGGAGNPSDAPLDGEPPDGTSPSTVEQEGR